MCLLKKLLVDKPKLLYAFVFLLVLFYNNLWYGKCTKMESGRGLELCTFKSKKYYLLFTGRMKRFQPNKPATKAQVAVTLASGRMAEAISAELSRLESESSARKAEIEDIKLELVERGDIQRYWDKKLTEEKKRLLDMEELYLAAVSNLGEEKMVQEKIFSEYLKEKASIDCQRQLLLSLKEEVDGMTEKLLSERSVCETEQNELHNMRADLQNQLEGMLDTKSVLEAEKEALRILR